MELKACPFCGSNNVSGYAFSIMPDARVECNDCGASTAEFNAPNIDGQSDQEREQKSFDMAKEAWNKRASILRDL